MNACVYFCPSYLQVVPLFDAVVVPHAVAVKYRVVLLDHSVEQLRCPVAFPLVASHIISEHFERKSDECQAAKAEVAETTDAAVVGAASPLFGVRAAVKADSTDSVVGSHKRSDVATAAIVVVVVVVVVVA